MKRRCNDRRNPSYGARGIKVCPEWRDDFKAFERWGLASGYRRGLSIERINNDGDYEPGNCRWATAKEQAANRRNSLFIEAFGERKIVADWLRDARCKVKEKALYFRLSKGYSGEDALRGNDKRGERFLTAFGETKRIGEWSRDRRCKTTMKILWQRVKAGVAPEAAISVADLRRLGSSL